MKQKRAIFRIICDMVWCGDLALNTIRTFGEIIKRREYASIKDYKIYYQPRKRIIG